MIKLRPSYRFRIISLFNILLSKNQSIAGYRTNNMDPNLLEKNWYIELKDGSVMKLPPFQNEWVLYICRSLMSDDLAPAHSNPIHSKSPLRARAFLDSVDFQTYVIVIDIGKASSKNEKQSVIRSLASIEVHFANNYGGGVAKLICKEEAPETHPLLIRLGSFNDVLLMAKLIEKRPPVFSNAHLGVHGIPQKLKVSRGEVVVGDKELQTIDFLLSTFEKKDGKSTWLPERSVFNKFKQYNLGDDLHQLLYVIFSAKSGKKQEIDQAFSYIPNYNPKWTDLGLVSYTDPLHSNSFTIYTAHILPSMEFGFESCLLRQILVSIFSIDDAVSAKGDSDAFAFMEISSLFSFANCHHLLMTVPEVDGLKQLFIKSGLSDPCGSSISLGLSLQLYSKRRMVDCYSRRLCFLPRTRQFFSYRRLQK